MTRKKVSFSASQKLEYAKLMLEENYTNKKSKRSLVLVPQLLLAEKQYLGGLSGHTG